MKFSKYIEGQEHAYHDTINALLFEINQLEKELELIIIAFNQSQKELKKLKKNNGKIGFKPKEEKC